MGRQEDEVVSDSAEDLETGTGGETCDDASIEHQAEGVSKEFYGEVNGMPGPRPVGFIQTGDLHVCIYIS